LIAAREVFKGIGLQAGRLHETYRRRADRKEEPGRGLGVAWEAAIITDETYRNAARNTRFIPVLFSPADAAHIPPWLGERDHCTNCLMNS
jgi:hypothetical protein